MKRTTRLHIYHIFYENRKILLFDFCILCFICGSELSKTADYDFGVWGYIIIILTNHYYILYCLVPVIFIVLSRRIRETRNVEIIRYQNRFQQNRRNTAIFSLWLLILFSIKIAVVFLIGIKKYGLSVKLEPVPMENFYSELLEIFNLYVEFFDNPVIAVAAIVCCFIFGFTLLQAVMGYINIKYGYEKLMTSGMVIYVLMIIGFKTELKSLIPILCFNNYILLHHGLFINGAVNFVLILVAAVLTLLFCLGVRVRIKKVRINNFIITDKEKLITVAVVTLLLATELIRGLAGINFNVKDVMFSFLFGSGEQLESFMSWLKLAIVYLLPVFMIGISDQRIRQYSHAPMLIRFQNKNHFEIRVLQKNLSYIFVYTLGIWAVGCITYYLGDPKSELEDHLLNIFGAGYTAEIWHIFMGTFFVHLLCALTVFKVFSKICGGVISMIVLIAGKYFFYMMPSIDFLDINFGLIDLYGNLKSGYLLDEGFLIIAVIPAAYVSVLLIRRFRHDSDTVRKYL